MAIGMSYKIKELNPKVLKAMFKDLGDMFGFTIRTDFDKNHEYK